MHFSGKADSGEASFGASASSDAREAFHNDSHRGISVAARPQSAPTPNIAKTIHSIFRGRYPLIIALGLLTGGLGAFLGWKFAWATYRSEGLVRIAYSLPVVYQQSDLSGPMPVFDTYMQDQKTLILSRRIASAALRDPVWNGLLPPEPEQWLNLHLKVDVKPKSELISVSASDYDPLRAVTAVNSVISAYVSAYKEQQSNDKARLAILIERKNELSSQVDDARTSLQNDHYGAAELDTLYKEADAELTTFKANEAATRLALASAADAPPVEPTTRPSDEAASPKPAAPDASELTAEQIAQTDTMMSKLLDDQTRLENEVRQLELDGFLPNHKRMIAAKFALENARSAVNKHLAAARQYRAATGQNLGEAHAGGGTLAGLGAFFPAAKPVSVLRANERSLKKLCDDAEKEVAELGKKREALRVQTEKFEGLKKQLADVTHTIEVLEGQSKLGRLSMVSSGSEAQSPERDNRYRVAGVAGAGGLCLPAGLLLLLSYLKRRYRYADETESEESPVQAPLLGILPELDAEDASRRDMAAAAHSIHQIRVSLRAQRPGAGSSLYLVTSATSGEGKTTLTMSLGLSFAASGVRTLVIDADLVGRKLTNTMQARDLDGLNEAIDAGSLRQRIRKTDAGLYVLTAGRASARHACSLSPTAVKSLVAEARKYFEIVLIDTGPILGSLEASVFAQEVDGVIFAISRGQERQVVDLAMKRLRSLGVRNAGCIFNRAKPQDFNRSPYGSSSYTSSIVSAESSAPEAAKRLIRFGSLVQAVAAGIPSMEN